MLKCGGLCRMVLMEVVFSVLMVWDILVWVSDRWLLLLVVFGFGDYGFSV